ncbi:MAG: hypothetical protein WC784_00935 [Candidatus Shapirobacteria bacterium]|jgi:hypothetical protein
MKKIIGLLFLVLSLFVFSFVNLKKVEAAVTCDYSACPYGCYTDGSCKPKPIVPTSTPAPTSAPGCWDCMTGCCTNPTSYGGEGCISCPVNPTLPPENTPTTAPTAGVTVVPTAVPCEDSSDGDNICNKGSSYCENFCLKDGTNNADVKCATNNDCGTKLVPVWCNDSGIVNVGEIYCPISGTPTTYCHPFQCYDAPNSTYCPDFDPTKNATCVADYGGAGNCDNCFGVNCGSCGIILPTSAPTPVPGCTPDCSSDPCRNNICSDQTCLGVCGGYCLGALYCSAPTFTSLAIKNASSTAVSVDVNNRNNICEATFYNDPEPRKVIFEASVADLDGYTDISSVELRWNGNVYDMTLSSGLGTEAIYAVTLDYSAVNDSGTYPLEINVTDSKSESTGWTTTNRNWKVWDCQILVSGTIYDSSGGQSCASAFLLTAPPEMNFSAITFSNVSGVGDVPMAVNSPNYGSGNLIWGQTYLPLVNGGSAGNIDGDLRAAGRFTQIVDTAASVTSCPVTTSFNIGDYVSAYSVAPEAKVDLSYVRAQEGWFQVWGAGVKAKNNIDSGVPVTMEPLSSRALSLSGATSDNDLISSLTFTNINGFNDDSAYGNPNNWWIRANANDSNSYNYQYFYNNFLVKNGVGLTGTDWNGRPSEGVYFVNGNLNIDSDFSLASDKFMMVVVSGKITIANNINQLDGFYVADGGIEASGVSDNQLMIKGSLYSRNNIRLARSYTNKEINNISPAVVVDYNPALIFNMPGTLMRVLSGWREE